MSTLSVVRSRRLRQEEHRAGILHAAADAIAENGYHGMSMRGLARATGRSLASFYNYFPSKEDLLFLLQTDAFETLTGQLEAALEGVDDPVERLYLFVLNHVRYLTGHKSLMRVLVHEAAALPAARRKKVRLLKEAYFHIVREIVESIVARDNGSHAMDAAELERVTYSVFGMLNWSYGWYDRGRHGTPEDVARTIHSVAVYGLLGRAPDDRRAKKKA